MARPPMRVDAAGNSIGKDAHGKIIKYRKRDGDGKPLKNKGTLYSEHRKILGLEATQQKK